MKKLVLLATIGCLLPSSLRAQITITRQPAILVTNAATGTWPPLGGMANDGEDLIIPVSAGGAGILAYQWQRDGTNLLESAEYVGTTKATLRLPRATTNEGGVYTVLIGDGSQSITSAPVTLSVHAPIAVYAGRVFDLQAQFDTNGAATGTTAWGWQYCEGLAFDSQAGINPGGQPLPSFMSGTLDPSWNAPDFGAGQPGWDGNQPGGWAGWSQRVDNGTINNTSNGNKDSLPGMITGYRNSAMWVVPSDYPPGSVYIAGGIWNLRHYHRSGTWRIFHNDGNVTSPLPTPLTQGLVQDTSGSSSGPMSFDQGSGGAAALQAIPYAPGDTFRIDCDEDDFVGVRFTVSVITNLGATLTQVPQSQSVPVGDTVTFSVAAFGTAPFAYQWQFNGTNLPGATTSSLVLTNLQTNQSGLYTVVVSNSVATISKAAVLNVFAGLYVSTQPAAFQLTNDANGVWSPPSGTFNSGQHVFTSVTAGGAGPFTYQWKLNGSNVPGLTDATLALTASTNRGGAWTVDISNGTNTITSRPITLAVFPPIPVFPGTAFDLQTQFDTNGSPSGTTALGWQYCEGLAWDGQSGFDPGGRPLPSFVTGTMDPNWNSPDFGAGQPGWDGHRPGPWAGWAQRVDNGTINNTGNGNKDSLPGMIIGYKNSAVWVAPSNYPAGIANVTGGIWNMRRRGISGTWRIFHNDGYVSSPLPAPLTQGSVDDTSGDSNGPMSFDRGSNGSPALRNIPYAPGDTFRIDSDAEEFVGVQFTIYTSTNLGIAVMPLSQSVPASNTVSFVVVPSGNTPFTYQWRFFGTNLPGATNASLVLPHVDTAQAGPYDVVVGNSAGTITSRPALLTVFAGLYISSQPAPFVVTNAATGTWPPLGGTFNSGEYVFTSVGIGGTGQFTCQWKVNGVKVPGQTNTTLLIAASTNLAGAWTLEATDGTNIVTTQPVTLAVHPPIPVFPGLAADLKAQFDRTANPTPLGWTYETMLQWNGQPAAIPLTTFDPNWNSPDFGPGQPGWDGVIPGPWAGWAQRVDNGTINNTGGGNKDSMPGQIIGYQNSVVWTVPATVPAGEANIAGGIWNLRHYGRAGGWRIYHNDGNPLTSGTVEDFSGSSTGPLSFDRGTGGPGALRNIPYAPGDTFRFECDNNDFIGAEFTIYTLSDPGMSAPPTNQTVFVGDTATFSVVAAGTGPFTYQWQRNGVNLAGANGSSVILTNVQTNQAGSYNVVVNNTKGSVTSFPANLTVVLPVYITSEPTVLVSNAVGSVFAPPNQTPNSGETVVIAATAGGIEPLSYQWYANGTELAGQTASAMTLLHVTTNQVGNYTVTVTNRFGQTATSAAAVLSVNAPIPVFAGYAHDLKTEFSLLSNPTPHGWQYSTMLSLGGGVISQTVDPNWNATDFGPGQPGWDGTQPGGYAGFAQRVDNGTIDNAPNGNKEIPVGGIIAYKNSALLIIPTNDPGGTANIAGGIWNVRRRGQSGTLNVYHNDALLTSVPIQDNSGTSDGPMSFDLGNNSQSALRNISYGAGDTFRVESVEEEFVGLHFTVYTQSDPIITTNPPESIVVPVGGTLDLSVGAAGTTPLSYQWQHNEVKVPGAINPRLTLSGITTNAAGSYAVVVSNSKGRITSYPALVNVLLVQPRLTAGSSSDGRLRIAWTGLGILQTASNANGPYTDVTGATTPYLVSPTNAQQFFRVRGN